jgi:hypothetical protein
MKKLLYIVLAVFVLNACDKGFEELNVDPVNLSQAPVGNKLSTIELFSSGGNFENHRVNIIYNAMMMQHLSSPLLNFAEGDKYILRKDYTSALFIHYRQPVKWIEDLLVQLDDEDAPDEMKAIVRILRVFVFQRLTDHYGDIPYSEAGKAFIDGVYTPKYDAQSHIYIDMLEELEAAAAILSLDSGTSAFGSADFLFQGDLSKWKKFANSMMLRLGFRLIKVDPAAAQNWVTKAILGGVMESNTDIVYFQHAATPLTSQNGNASGFAQDDQIRLSHTFVDFMQTRNDPRLPILAARKRDGSNDSWNLIGLPNGLDANLLLQLTGENDTNEYAEPSAIVKNLATPMFWQTYAEVEFMLAEAAERWGLAGGDPEPHYNAGVRAAMKMLEIYGSEAVIDDADIDAYLLANPFDATNAIEQINTQYWTATFLNDYESYSNWRRSGFPVLTPVNYPGNATNGTIPRRMTWDESEKINNLTNYNAAIAAQGADLLTTRIWWDIE